MQEDIHPHCGNNVKKNYGRHFTGFDFDKMLQYGTYSDPFKVLVKRKKQLFAITGIYRFRLLKKPKKIIVYKK